MESNAAMIVPDSVLIDFFEASEKQAHGMALDRTLPLPSLVQIRQQLLEAQLDCLNIVVEKFNICSESSGHSQLTTSQVRELLKQMNTMPLSSAVTVAMDRMNEAARQAFCRLVLYTECLRSIDSNNQRSDLKASGTMARTEILEFVGLCNVAVRLRNVIQHMSNGTPLFPDVSMGEAALFPQERLDKIQRLFLKAVGYDPDHGSAEVKRIVSSYKPACEIEDNDEANLAHTFTELATNMDAAIQNATMQAMYAGLSDYDQGGSTRVTGVEYSEKVIDAKSGKVIATKTDDESFRRAPSLQKITEHEQESHVCQNQVWDMTKNTSRLHQEILGDLLTMEPEEREAKLAEAKKVAHVFVAKLKHAKSGSERVALVQEMDISTQRLLVMEKIWESILNSNGGAPPTIRGLGRYV